MVKINDLLKVYDQKSIRNTHKLCFHGVDGFDVYNITAPFENNGKNYIAGRVEKRDSELSEIVFFMEQDEVNYIADPFIPRLSLQDPYITKINDEIVIGGTEVFDHPTKPGALWYNAVKYRGSDLNHLTRFFEGPNGMKDIRLVQIETGQILVFTRPQGKIGGRGQIGTVIIDNLEQLCEVDLENAPLLNTFIAEEWGGANEAHVLGSDKIGVLSHIAKFDASGDRHYYASTFVYKISTKEVEDFKIITTRADLNAGESKRPDLQDVVFSGGIKLDGEIAKLYVGAGDCEAHYVEIDNPFIER